MKIVTPFAWFAGAGALLIVSAVGNDIELGMLSFLAGGVGVGTLFPALKERWSSHGRESTHSRLHEMEERLRLTEDELASATRELTALKEQQEFDLSLQLSKASTAQLTAVNEHPTDAPQRGV